MFRIAPGSVVFSLATLCATQTAVAASATDQNAPLLQAHQYLLAARARMAEQDYEGVKPPLRQAENALAEFERQDLGPLGEQAELMRQDMEAYASRIGRDASVDQIDEWIKTIERWQGNSKQPLGPPPPL